jgi:hypothetical protein
MTPEGRLIKPIDETAIDQGYDSDGLRAPWEGSEELSLDGPELEDLVHRHLYPGSRLLKMSRKKYHHG